jgi:hypothetical protein
MNFLQEYISFTKQNEIVSETLIRDNYYINRYTNTFSFYTKSELGIIQPLESYVLTFFIHPKAIAITVFDGTSWIRYIYKNGKYIRDYVSRYFILSFKNKLLIQRDNDSVYRIAKFKETEVELVTEKILTAFTNFIYTDTHIHFLNDNTHRKLSYNIDSDTYEDRVMKQNPLICKKTTVYFDNISGVDVYNTKKRNLVQSVNRSYKLEKYLYVLKEDNNKYILINLFKHEVLFTGKSFHLINNNGWILDQLKNEIAVITEKEVLIMPYDKYKIGIKEPITTIKRKTLQGENHE